MTTRMTVRSLIDILERFDSDTTLVIADCDGAEWHLEAVTIAAETETAPAVVLEYPALDYRGEALHIRPSRLAEYVGAPE